MANTIKKVLSNVEQSLSTDEQAQARTNIGAVSELSFEQYKSDVSRSFNTVNTGLNTHTAILNGYETRITALENATGSGMQLISYQNTSLSTIAWNASQGVAEKQITSWSGTGSTEYIDVTLTGTITLATVDTDHHGYVFTIKNSSGTTLDTSTIYVTPTLTNTVLKIPFSVRLLSVSSDNVSLYVTNTQQTETTQMIDNLHITGLVWTKA